MVRTVVTATVRGLSRYVRIPAPYCTASGAQACVLKLDIAIQLETLGRTGTCNFRYADIIGRVRTKHFECG